MHAAGMNPIDPYPGALKPWRCTCQSCGREVTPRYAMIQQGHGGCGYCAGKRVDAVEAEHRMREKGVEPLVPYPGSSIPWSCACLVCGREVTPMYSSILSGQSACKFCARRAVDESDAEESLRLANLEPLEPYPGAATPWKCRCLRCGTEVRPRWSSRRTPWPQRRASGGRGTPTPPVSSA